MRRHLEHFDDTVNSVLCVEVEGGREGGGREEGREGGLRISSKAVSSPFGAAKCKLLTPTVVS